MKKLLAATVLCIFTYQLSAQQFTSVSQYMLNNAYLNPAYTGEGERYHISALYRGQWAGYRDYDNNAVAPTLQLLTGFVNLNNTNHSLGGIFVRDKIAYITGVQAQVSYAYTFRLSAVQSITAGVRAGLFSQSIDFGSYVLKHGDDPFIANEKQREAHPDATLGIWYDHNDFYAGVSAKSFLSHTSPDMPGSLRNHAFIATTGYHAALNDRLKLIPSIQLIADQENFSLDASTLVNYDNIFWTGLSYRHEEAVSALLGLGLQEGKLRVSYGFDYITGNRGASAGSSHEIMLSYAGGKYKPKQPKYRPGKVNARKTPKPVIRVSDKDRDGVPDARDKCPDEPGFKKLSGCPDSDADGVADKDDKCPQEHGLRSMNGCADTDQDGTPDAEDRCPETPGPRSFKGCADRDDDGLSDPEDKCPDIPGLVKDSGCPVSFTQEKLGHVTFTTGLATLEETSYGYLDEVIAILKEYPDTRVIIEGHTDSEGEDAFNMALSRQRAETILNYFIEKGLDPQRLSTAGYGETKPVDTNNSPEGRRKNRRVEIHFIKRDE